MLGLRLRERRSRTGCSPALLLMGLLAAGCTPDGSEPAGDGAFHWTIATVTEIDAPPDEVWKVLVDLPAYRDWNPFIVEASGTVAVGDTLSLRMALPGWQPMTIRPRLLVVDPGRELRWKGRLLIPGLFDGEHAFVLPPLPGGRTRLDHWERFGGLLLPIARSIVDDGTVESFRALDAALARRAESTAAMRS